MSKSVSLELSSAKLQMSDREKALWTCWGPRAGHHPSLGPGFFPPPGKLASVDSVPLLGHWLP